MSNNIYIHDEVFVKLFAQKIKKLLPESESVPIYFVDRQNDQLFPKLSNELTKDGKNLIQDQICYFNDGQKYLWSTAFTKNSLLESCSVAYSGNFADMEKDIIWYENYYITWNRMFYLRVSHSYECDKWIHKPFDYTKNVEVHFTHIFGPEVILPETITIKFLKTNTIMKLAKVYKKNLKTEDCAEIGVYVCLGNDLVDNSSAFNSAQIAKDRCFAIQLDPDYANSAKKYKLHPKWACSAPKVKGIAKCFEDFLYLLGNALRHSREVNVKCALRLNAVVSNFWLDLDNHTFFTGSTDSSKQLFSPIIMIVCAMFKDITSINLDASIYTNWNIVNGQTLIQECAQGIFKAIFCAKDDHCNINAWTNCIPVTIVSTLESLIMHAISVNSLWDDVSLKDFYDTKFIDYSVDGEISEKSVLTLHFVRHFYSLICYMFNSSKNSVTLSDNGGIGESISEIINKATKPWKLDHDGIIEFESNLRSLIEYIDCELGSSKEKRPCYAQLFSISATKVPSSPKMAKFIKERVFDVEKVETLKKNLLQKN